GQFRRIDATGNRRALEPHVPGIRHTHMTEAADTEHSDKITGLRRRISQRAERRESRAQQRRRIDRRQVGRDRHKPARLCDHDFGISAIMMNAGILLVPTVHEIAIQATPAHARGPAENTQPPPLPHRPALDTGTKAIDWPNELVAWDAGPINGELALYRAGIRVADPTRLDTNPDLTRRGRRQFPLHHFQAAGLTRLHCAIACRCHRRLLRFEKALLPSIISAVVPDTKHPYGCFMPEKSRHVGQPGQFGEEVQKAGPDLLRQARAQAFLGPLPRRSPSHSATVAHISLGLCVSTGVVSVSSIVTSPPAVSAFSASPRWY